MMENKEMYDKIFPLYMEWVERVSEDLEFKTHFRPDEIVAEVIKLINENYTLDGK